MTASAAVLLAFFSGNSSSRCSGCCAALTVAALLLLAAGCAAPRPATDTGGPSAEQLDSLRAQNQRLSEINAALRDSLRFRRDVETGRYYRRVRGLRDRIGRMNYALSQLREGGRTVELIRADALFEPASARLTGEGRTRLDTLAARLRRTYPERRFLIEGHADGAPLSAELQKTYASNWELSALRAAAVTRYLTAGSGGFAKKRLRLAAFADTRPVASNETAAGRRRNRRVRVAVLPKPRAFSDAEDADW
jgi:chemotaxis protein MotB